MRVSATAAGTGGKIPVRALPAGVVHDLLDARPGTNCRDPQNMKEHDRADDQPHEPAVTSPRRPKVVMK